MLVTQISRMYVYMYYYNNNNYYYYYYYYYKYIVAIFLIFSTSTSFISGMKIFRSWGSTLAWNSIHLRAKVAAQQVEVLFIVVCALSLGLISLISFQSILMLENIQVVKSSIMMTLWTGDITHIRLRKQKFPRKGK